MFPVGDDNSDRRITPVVNYVLIALNIIVFVFFQGLDSTNAFTMAFVTVPEEILTGHDVVTRGTTVTDPMTGQMYSVPGLGATPISVYITLLTSMFMHAGFAHIAGNMLYLWIFGDNIEDRIGHGRYLLFYLVCGVVASLAQVAVVVLGGGDTQLPSLGASGAISGALGAYLALFPGRRVKVIFMYFLHDMPALVVIGGWFVYQLVLGLGMLGGAGGGVAYGAHIGGFIAGFLLIRLFAIGKPATHVAVR
ncbi:MAG TPA: rhomboid family intramembrane serine protease [Bacteroidota bacterium]|nr:rhomboid family intramembrane serine protease [Bacteroidota bacterium]